MSPHELSNPAAPPPSPVARAVTEPPSRRSALARGAAMAAVGLGAALGVTTPARVARAQAAGDTAVLNGALAAEYNAIKAYDAGAAILAAPPAGDPLAAAAPTVLAVAAHFQAQHREHATALAAMVTAGGGVPTAESSVNFTAPAGFTPGVANVIKLAANAEKAASITYTEALRTVTAATAAKLLASIGGAETEHFIVLSLLARGVVAATATTQAMASEVVPRAFVAAAGAGTTGLETVADFTYA